MEQSNQSQLIPLEGVGPVEGPMNWIEYIGQMYGIGNDCSIPSPNEPSEGDENTPLKPLIDEQMVFMRSDILRNIRFLVALGEGAFGKVYEVSAQLKVKDMPGFEPVWKRFKFGCKVIRHFGADLTFLEISLNDMKGLRYLRHENICNMIEIIGIPDRKTKFPYSIVCVFFELCDGDITDLIEMWLEYRPDHFVGNWILPEMLNRHWFAQIASALHYIHSNNVIHGDILPPNIFISVAENGTENFADMFLNTLFKLGDFGQSTDALIENLTQNKKQKKMNQDIKKLGAILEAYGRPHGNEAFVSEFLIDLVTRMENGTITTQAILEHQWLQSNTELRTEPFIWREHTVEAVNLQFEVQPSFKDWENASKHPSLYPDFEPPFGKVQRRHKQLDPLTQQWIPAYDPIQGAPNFHELID